MIKKILAQIKKRKKTFAVLVVVFLVGIGFAVKGMTGTSTETKYYLSTVEKGTISTVVSGSGQVYGQDQIELSPEVSGKITSVSVQDNQAVAEGATLVTINSTSAYQTVRNAQAALASAQLALEKLKEPAEALSLLQAKNALAQAERTVAGLQPTDEEIAAAEKTVEKAERDLEEVSLTSEQDVSSAVEEGYNAVVSAFLELPGIKNDLADFIGTENSAEEYIGFYNLLAGSSYTEKLLIDYYSAEDKLNLAWADYLDSDLSSNSEVKAILIEETLDAAQALSTALNDANNLLDAIQSEGYSHSAATDIINEMIPIISADILSTNSLVSSIQNSTDTLDRVNLTAPYDVANAEDTLADAETALAELKAGPDSDALAKAQEDLAEKQQQLIDLEAGADESELADQELVVGQKQNALTSAYEDLAKYTIKAPVAGVVAGLSVKRGDTVSSGTTIATLVSDQKVAVISLNEVDVAKVKVGDKATLVFDAIEDLTISGTVINVDMIGSTTQSVVTYDVHIAFDTQDERILPGMSVTADIVTEVKTDILVIDSGAIESEGDIYYIQKFDQTYTDTEMAQGVVSTIAPTAVTIEVGITNDTDTEIVSGLSEGDQVIIRTTTSSSSSSSSSTSSAASLFSTGGGPSGGMPPD